MNPATLQRRSASFQPLPRPLVSQPRASFPLHQSHFILVVGMVLLAAAALVWSANLRHSTLLYWLLDVVAFFPQTWAWWFLQVVDALPTRASLDLSPSLRGLS